MSQHEDDMLKIKEIGELVDAAVSCWNAKELRSRYNTNLPEKERQEELEARELEARRLFFKAKSLLLEDIYIYDKNKTQIDDKNLKENIEYLLEIIRSEIDLAAESALLNPETIKDQE